MRLTPLRLAAPNLVSLASMGLGLASVALSASGRFELAAWLVIYSCFLDKADGAVARALDAGSDFGVQMDSFCDFTAFGVAPGALMWFLGPQHGLPVVWCGFAAASFPMTASIRLARFNVAGFEDHEFFSGLPTTFAAGLFAATVLTLFDISALPRAAHVVPSAMVVLAVLMVSPFRLPKLKLNRGRLVNTLQVVAACIAAVVAVLQVLPELPLAFGLIYLAIGALVGSRSPASRPSCD